jgi:hypothetical protein
MVGLVKIKIMKEYLDQIIRAIYESEASLPVDDKMEQRLLEIWVEQIVEHCKDYYNSYVLGEREHYYMTESEYNEIFEKSGLLYSEELLNGLIDKGLIEAKINESGDIVYGTTELGNKYV